MKQNHILNKITPILCGMAILSLASLKLLLGNPNSGTTFSIFQFAKRWKTRSPDQRPAGKLTCVTTTKAK